MNDIFGTEVKPGDFILKSMTNRYYSLYRVLAIKKSLKCERIRRRYESFGSPGNRYFYEKIKSHTSPHTFLIVHPPAEVVYLFNKNSFDKSDEPLLEQFKLV